MDTPNFTLPEDLSTLTAEELEGLRADAVTKFDELYDQPRNAENVEALRGVKAATDAIDGAASALAEMDAEVEALAGAVRGVDEDEDEDAPVDKAEDAEAAPIDEADVEAEVEVDAEVDFDPPADSAEDDEDDEDDMVAEVVTPSDDPSTSTSTSTPDNIVELITESDEALTTEQEPITVAASSSPDTAPASPSPTAINANRPDTGAPSRASVHDAHPNLAPATIVAASGVPDFGAGQTIGMPDVAAAFDSLTASFPKGGPGIHRAGLAKITKSFPDTLKVPRGADVAAYADQAANEKSLPGGNLVASGGWCAPSETWYELVSMETDEGLISLPSVQVSRGGVKHTLGPDFRSIYDGTGYFHYTEAEDFAGDYDGAGAGTKPCMVIPCPSFVEDRLDLDGLCITGGLLQDVAYPEAKERFISGALVAHAHKINSLRLADLVAGSDAVTPTSFGGPTVSILSALELVGTDVRYAQRLSQSMTLEVVLPYWVRGAIRADLSNRLGVDLLSVTDSMIDAWFRERKVAPQYVYDWQDDMAGLENSFGDEDGGSPIVWPATVDFLMYPAGTWVNGESDVITIDAQYDGSRVETNDFLALFTEEGWMTMKRSHDSRVVTVALGDQTNLGDTHGGTATDTIPA